MSTCVLHVELGRHLYGGAKQVTYLINALEQHDNIRQHLVCTQDSEIQNAPLGRCNVHALKYSGETDFLFIRRLLSIVKETKPNIIHIHSRRGADVWGAIIAKMTGIPSVCTRRVDNLESRFSYYKYKQFDAVISISEGVQSVVAKHCEGVKHQLVIHSAVDLDEYSLSENKQWLHDTFDIPSDHTVIANFAQYISRKGQADVILAMHDVLHKHKKVTCLLFGKGGLEESYQSLIERHGLADNVKLCGFTSDVAKILPNVDIVIHPAYAEGLGVILLQAGASKRAVITSPVGGIPEIVTHKETGLMVAPGDIDAIGESLVSLIEQPTLRYQYGNALYQHVAEKFSITKMANAYVNLYTSLTQGDKDTNKTVKNLVQPS